MTAPRFDDDIPVRIHNADPSPLPDPGAPPPGVSAPPAGGAPGAGPPAAGDDDLDAIISEENVAECVSGLFDWIASRRGEHWRLDDDDAANIAEPLTEELRDAATTFPVVGRVVGAVGGHRLQLALAVGFVVTPRLRTDLRRAREHRDAILRAGRPAPPVATSTRDATPAARADDAAGLGDDLGNKILMMPVKE